MERSPFANLPAELRVHIYELALSCANITIYEVDHPDGSARWGCSAREDGRMIGKGEIANLSALTKTCKQIRCESIKIFYAANYFTVRGPCEYYRGLAAHKMGAPPARHVSVVNRLRSTIGAQHWEMLRHIKIDLSSHLIRTHEPTTVSTTCEEIVETAESLIPLALAGRVSKYAQTSTSGFRNHGGA